MVGHFLTIEPISSTRPRFNSDSRGSLIDKLQKSGLAMQCYGQGYPVPTFRYFSYSMVFSYATLFFPNYYYMDLFHKSEPVGSVRPQLSFETKILSSLRRSGQSVTLLCNAQGFPTPVVR